MSELTDLVVPLADLWPPALTEPALAALGAVDTRGDAGPARCFHILDDLLVARLDIAHVLGLGVIGAAVRRLAEAGPGGSVRAVADDLGVSTRYLRRAFDDAVGLGPKTLHRVLRFQRLIRRLDGTGMSSEPDWSYLAVSCGYFDQSHMIRDFRLLTELRPREYLELRSVDPNFAGEAEPGPAR